MHMDETGSNGAIAFLKIKATDDACRTIMVNALLTSYRVTFVPVHRDPQQSPFDQYTGWVFDVIWIESVGGLSGTVDGLIPGLFPKSGK
jgi:hypothetical protein